MRQEDFRGPFNERLSIFAVVFSVTILWLAAATGLAAATRPLTDVSISDAVENQLLMDRAVPSHLIDVITVDGIVTLSGSVDNILAKERAAKIARIVKGVRAVVNELEVDPPLLRTDGQISRDVIDALLNDPATDSYEIDVRVDDNLVTLTGTVNSWQEKNLCEKVAKGVRGVKGVSNAIRVDWLQERSNDEITKEIEKTLEWDAFVDHALIDVAVKDGKVTLSGIVGSAAEKNEAYWDAHVHGVTFVDDSGLEVKKWARDADLKREKYVNRSDKQIENAVSDALIYDPRVSSFKITPEAAGSMVTLRGTVDNLKAKRAAAQDARNTVGVRWVVNRIKVRPAEPLTDQKIENKIQDALLRDPYVESYEITADVRNGIAKLYGTVDTFFEKFRADDVVSRVNGVIMVDNNLIVREDPPAIQDLYDPYVDDYWYRYDWYDYRGMYASKSDWQIKNGVEDALFWSPFVDADDVNVTVDQGKVTLTGTVDSWSELNAAIHNAYKGGAVYVHDNLTVK